MSVFPQDKIKLMVWMVKTLRRIPFIILSNLVEISTLFESAWHTWYTAVWLDEKCPLQNTACLTKIGAPIAKFNPNKHTISCLEIDWWNTQWPHSTFLASYCTESIRQWVMPVKSHRNRQPSRHMKCSYKCHRRVTVDCITCWNSLIY